MMLVWMGYALAVAAVFGLLASSVERAIPARRIARRTIWIAAIAASSLLPVLTSQVGTFGDPRTGSASGPAPVDAAAAVPALAGSIDRLMGAAWLTASLLLSVLLVGSGAALRRSLRGWPRETVDGEPAVIANDFGPALVGLIAPQIVLPRWALGLDPHSRALVLDHEREHRRAGDHALAATGLVALVLFPWNVALWWQLRRLRLAIEMDCDARVVARHGGDAAGYGEVLVLARQRRSAPALAALTLAPFRSSLGRRLEALAGGRRPTRAAWAGAIATTILAGTAFSVVPAPRLPVPEWSDRSIAAVYASPDAKPITAPSSILERREPIVDGQVPAVIDGRDGDRRPAAIGEPGEKSGGGVVPSIPMPPASYTPVGVLTRLDAPRIEAIRPRPTAGRGGAIIRAAPSGSVLPGGAGGRGGRSGGFRAVGGSQARLIPPPDSLVPPPPR